MLKFKIEKIGWDRESIIINPSINVLILVKLALNLVRSKFSDILKVKYVSHSQKLFQSDLFEVQLNKQQNMGTPSFIFDKLLKMPANL